VKRQETKRKGNLAQAQEVVLAIPAKQKEKKLVAQLLNIFDKNISDVSF